MKLCLSFGLVFRLSTSLLLSTSLSVLDAHESNAKLDTSASAILDKARAVNDEVYSALQSFVCDEKIERFSGDLSGRSVSALDIVTARLSFEQGIEEYSNVLQNKHPRSSLTSLTGVWSEGEFGTLLLQSQELLSTQPVRFENFGAYQGEQVAFYRFDVSEEDSLWDLRVSGHHYRLPFSTEIAVSVESGEILKINRASISMPAATRISAIEWGITLGHVALNGSKWLLPVTGSYAAIYSNLNRREWNEISFSGYQRYTAQTNVKFQQAQ